MHQTFNFSALETSAETFSSKRNIPSFDLPQTSAISFRGNNHSYLMYRYLFEQHPVGSMFVDVQLAFRLQHLDDFESKLEDDVKNVTLLEIWNEFCHYGDRIQILTSQEYYLVCGNGENSKKLLSLEFPRILNSFSFWFNNACSCTKSDSNKNFRVRKIGKAMQKSGSL